MVFDNMRFQIASILFLTITCITYVRYTKLPVMSTKCFSMMLVSTMIYEVMDIITVYTISHMDQIPKWVNLFAHQVFIGMLDVSIYFLFLYLFVLGKRQIRPNTRQYFIISIPLLIAMGMVLFGKIYYVCDDYGVYSYGMMPTTVYVVAAIYLTGIFVMTLLPKHFIFSKQNRIYIWAALGIGLATTLIQLMNRYMLVSGLGLALFIFLEFLNFENPKELVESQTGVMNRYALSLYITDCMESKRDFSVISIRMLDEEIIRKKYGNLESKVLFGRIATKLTELSKCPIFFPENDQFIIILRNLNREEEVLRKMKEKMSEIWEIRDAKIRMNTTYTLIDCPKYSEKTEDIMDTISYLSKNKDTGYQRNGDVIRINSNVNSLKNRENTIYEMLVNAIENDGFEMFYQPIYSTSRKKFVSAEALVRLKDHETLGYLSPEEFIRIAEERGLIIEIGNIIMEKVCEFMQRGDLKSMGISYIEVNVSGDQAVDEQLFGRFETIRKKYEITPEMINLEITETVAVEAVEMLQGNVKRFVKAGYSFSMDDFGTGYSNISKLTDSFYHLIKFDKSLIWPYFDGLSSKAKILLPNLVKTINELGYQIVAEGVETEEMVDMLTKHGVEYLQGYYYSKPINESEFLTFIGKHNVNG